MDSAKGVHHIQHEQEVDLAVVMLDLGNNNFSGFGLAQGEAHLEETVRVELVIYKQPVALSEGIEQR